MITINTLYTIQIYQGLSTDTKPVDNVPNGSIFVEMDTAKKYRFDKENEIWLDYDNPQPEGGDKVAILYADVDLENQVADLYKESNLTKFEDYTTVFNYLDKAAIVILDVNQSGLQYYPILAEISDSGDSYVTFTAFNAGVQVTITGTVQTGGIS